MNNHDTPAIYRKREAQARRVAMDADPRRAVVSNYRAEIEADAKKAAGAWRLNAAVFVVLLLALMTMPAWLPAVAKAAR